MGIDVEEFEFHRDEYEPVAAAMHELDDGSGRGWINLHPVVDVVDQDRVPTQTTLGAWFSGRGPAMAMATWTPSLRGSKPRSAQVGISHGSGPDALDRLSDIGVALPDGWTKRGDHAKHGIVVDLPEHEEPGVVITWMIVAGTILHTSVEPGEQWRARIHRPR